MKEILGENLETAFYELMIDARKTYESKNLHYEHQPVYQVWEMSDYTFEALCDVDEAEWQDGWGWWRWSDGSNQGDVNHRYNINNHYITAWDGAYRIGAEEENKNTSIDDRWVYPRKYSYLTQYFCDEMGASMEKNICALAIDMARQNHVKLSELFEKYQG